jgi:hypothetical protein
MSAVRGLIEKLLSDNEFYEKLVHARDEAEALKICTDAGLTTPFTKAELDAELLPLKHAAGLLVVYEKHIPAEGTHSRWVSRLATLGDKGRGCVNCQGIV